MKESFSDSGSLFESTPLPNEDKSAETTDIEAQKDARDFGPLKGRRVKAERNPKHNLGAAKPDRDAYRALWLSGNDQSKTEDSAGK